MKDTYRLASPIYSYPGAYPSMDAGGVSVCTMVGITVVIGIVYMTMQSSTYGPMSQPHARYHSLGYHHVQPVIASMLSKATHTINGAADTVYGISAKIVGHTAYIHKAKAHYALNSSVSDILVAEGSTSDAKLSDPEKESCKKAVQKHLDTHDNMLIMVFAPWCKHCHTMMHSLDSKAQGVSVLMVNAECVPAEYLGSGGLLNVEYFPTIAVWRNKQMSEAMPIERAVDLIQNGTGVAAKRARVVSSTSDDAAPVSDPFAGLF